MSRQISPENLLQQKQSALLRILKVIVSGSAQLTFYAAALGAIALTGGVGLPVEWSAFLSGVGMNALTGILERVARGEYVPDEEILQKVKAAVEESRIEERLATRDTQAMIAGLFRRIDVVRSAIRSSQYDILQHLTEQAGKYEILIGEIRDDIAMLYLEVQKLLDQGAEMLALQRRLYDLLVATAPQAYTPVRPGSAPPLPSLIIGRDSAFHDLKKRLGIIGGAAEVSPLQVLTAIRGWPGVGKTTVAAALAHDQDVADVFPDGVLWISLGPKPELFSALATWGRALGTDDLLRAKTLEEAMSQLTALLRNKRMLLIVDDVWEPEHAVPFKVGGRHCAMLVTTREKHVAQELAPTAVDAYTLPVLTEEDSLELLRILAPAVVVKYPKESVEIVRELEGLPLALQVAGHMLNAEAESGFGVTDLLAQLRVGAKLLEAEAPPDRADVAGQVIPTVASLLQRSTDRLDAITRDCFAYLGAFAPKPATFDLAAMQAVWQAEDPRPFARTLVDRGLLEFLPETGRYQMHALLVMHAKSMLTD